MNHYIFSRSNIEATAVASRQAETHHAMCKQLCQNDRTTHHGCIYQISVEFLKVNLISTNIHTLLGFKTEQSTSIRTLSAIFVSGTQLKLILHHEYAMRLA